MIIKNGVNRSLLFLLEIILIGCEGKEIKEINRIPFSVKSIAAKGATTCSISEDGTLWCWGRNDMGQLGDGTTADKNTPTQVGTDTTWSSVSAGWGHTCGIKTDGTLWCWGYYNISSGILGSRTIPTQVGTDTDWLMLSTFWPYTCAIKEDKSLWCSGDVNKLSPQLENNGKWAQVATANWEYCSVNIDGTLWCLGYSGLFSRVPKLIQVGEDNDWQEVAIGEGHLCAIKTDNTKLFIYLSDSNNRKHT